MFEMPRCRYYIKDARSGLTGFLRKKSFLPFNGFGTHSTRIKFKKNKKSAKLKLKHTIELKWRVGASIEYRVKHV